MTENPAFTTANNLNVYSTIGFSKHDKKDTNGAIATITGKTRQCIKQIVETLIPNLSFSPP